MLTMLNHMGGAGLGLTVLLAILFSSSAAIPARTAGQGAPAPEAVLQEARKALDNSDLSQSQLRQVIAGLEKQKDNFPQEIRFPLYLAEAYYRLADPDANVNREFPYYEKTEIFAREVLALDPNKVEGRYWYGLFLLKKAEKKGGLGAYGIVKEGIAELETVRRAIPTYDGAGASRVLGLMYTLAPGYTPFGNVKKAVEMLQEATRLAPDFILNRFYLANAYKKQGDQAAAVREYQQVLKTASAMPGEEARKIAAAAQTQLTSLDQTP